MYVDAEQRKQELMAKNKMQGLMFKMDDDPRITRVGRFIRRTSIDELPQFWNVLRGDMSLVGTRPPTLDEYEQYDSHHKRRLSMKPGITGCGRSAAAATSRTLRRSSSWTWPTSTTGRWRWICASSSKRWGWCSAATGAE